MRGCGNALVCAWAAILWLLATQAAAGDVTVDAPIWTDRYDPIFRKYSKRYFGPGWDWRWFKAQAIAESTLRPDARSRTGARGLMQILPSTFREIRKFEPEFHDVHSPRWNIAAGIWYDHFMYRHASWKQLPPKERLQFAFAGYTSGLGATLRAYKRARPPVRVWAHVAPHTRAETRQYVARIIQLKTGVPAARANRTPHQRGAASRIQPPTKKRPKNR
ncbi:MAG: transglycosylase SLT domain-containing protein [Panacagrimonas sp.]